MLATWKYQNEGQDLLARHTKTSSLRAKLAVIDDDKSI
jgi:hypothetical protein